jgi:hypothetical protein
MGLRARHAITAQMNFGCINTHVSSILHIVTGWLRQVSYQQGSEPH